MSVHVGLCPTCGALPPPHAVVCPNDGTELVSADNDPLLETTIGTYRVVRRLGVGGMGAVYEGIETHIDKRVALKIVHPHFTNSSTSSPVAEAKAVNAIQDRGIVDIYGFGRLPDGREYLVMELLVGEALDARIRRKKKLKLDEVMAIADPLLTSLEAAHQAGFVHRDIKASNVFIVRPAQGDEFPKLLDFGIATKASAERTVALGTPDYVAPEQAAGQAVGPAADLYAFGCLLFEMLTGHVPFPFDSSTRILKEHRFAQRPDILAERPDLPPALGALVSHLMQIDPAARPASARVTRDALRAAVATPEPTPEPAPSRPRWPLVVALAALVGGGWWWSRSTGDSNPAPQEPAADPVATAVKAAVAHVAERIDAGHLTEAGDGALDQLLAAQTAFPGRGEFLALRGSLVSDFTTRAQQALNAERPDEALDWVKALVRLDAANPEAAALTERARRAQFAARNGMAHVGDVFVDLYEYPNRPNVLPVAKVDWAEAVRLCRDGGKHLCTEDEWVTACRGPGHDPFPYGPTYVAGACNGKDRKPGAVAAAGTGPVPPTQPTVRPRRQPRGVDRQPPPRRRAADGGSRWLVQAARRRSCRVRPATTFCRSRRRRALGVSLLSVSGRRPSPFCAPSRTDVANHRRDPPTRPDRPNALVERLSSVANALRVVHRAVPRPPAGAGDV